MPATNPYVINPHDTFLGFDFGHKKIGVAIAHMETAIASPLTTLPAVNQQPNWPQLKLLIETWQPQGLVVGQSIKQDGSDNLVTPRIIKFCRQLHGRFNLPVYQVNETLTTFEAKQMLYNDLNVSAKKLWKVQDQLAAQRILLTWINEQHQPHDH